VEGREEADPWLACAGAMAGEEGTRPVGGGAAMLGNREVPVLAVGEEPTLAVTVPPAKLARSTFGKRCSGEGLGDTSGKLPRSDQNGVPPSTKNSP
jgi:hypothetical protein